MSNGVKYNIPDQLEYMINNPKKDMAHYMKKLHISESTYFRRQRSLKKMPKKEDTKFKKKIVTDDSDTISPLPSDLKADVEKIASIMSFFKDNETPARLGEVQSYLKEMGQLKPIAEEEIKESLKRLSAEDLIHVILPIDFCPQPAAAPNFNQAELESLFEESNI